MTQNKDAPPQAYTPALGRHWLTPAYDMAIAALTREAVWRGLLMRQIDAVAGDRILDVGCGTGTLVAMIAKATPGATVFGLDPDPDVLARARAKASSAGASASFIQGFLSQAVLEQVAPLTKITSSLVFHQVPLDEKRRMLALMRSALRPGGEAHVADYGAQSSPLQRWLFRQTVQRLDGVANTQPNADGVLPNLMREVGFRQVEETRRVATLSGSISVYRCAA